MINKCDICGKVFDETKAGNIAVVASHVNNHYESNTYHICPYCMTVFSSIYNIIREKNHDAKTEV